MPDNKQDPTLTFANGAPIANDEDSLTTAQRRYVLLSDIWLLEKHAHFNRERVPERVVHAKGSGAYGTFTVTNDISQYTKAAIFSKVGKKTDCLVRFSQVAGEQGYPDAGLPDVRGFAMKFYSEEGNWDLVGNNTPIFFVRDPLKFPDFIHSQKREPQTGLRSPTMQWDFWSNTPESLHQVLWLMGDRGLPKSYRHMNGYGSHTFSFINAKNERFWVKFHFKSQQGVECATWEESMETAKNPDSHREDLFTAIKNGEFPCWTLYVQIMPEKEANTYHVDPFDLTKVWYHGDYPLLEVGVMELNTNPANFFVDIEQSTFSPANFVPGISYSPDPMLQARLFAYGDAHRYRVGVNSHLLPPNKPRCPMHVGHRDGAMRFDDNSSEMPRPYLPTSAPGPKPDASFEEPGFEIPAGEAKRYPHREGYDDFTQASKLYGVMTKDARERLIKNITNHMGGVPEDIKVKQLKLFYQVEKELAQKLGQAFGIQEAHFSS